MADVMQTGQAGTMESNDIHIIVALATTGEGITIEQNSPVVKQYGSRIREVIRETLGAEGVIDAKVHANDKGALDCTIQARVKTAVSRALAKGAE